MEPKRLSSLTPLLYGALVYALLATPRAHAEADGRWNHWTTTWAASPQQMLSAENGIEPGVPGSLADQTVRQVLHVSVGGRAIRVVLSNEYGTAPLTVGEARIANTDTGPNIVPGSDRQLTFGGETRVVIPVGAPAISDPIELDVPALSDLTVSIYIPESTVLDTFHWTGQQTGYLAAGNVTSEVSVTSDTTFTSRLFVASVLSAGGPHTRTVAAFGDSITDGSSVTVDSNQRWPDILAERLAPYRVGTVNAGISGNQLLLDGMGDNAVARFERDVLSLPGVETAIVLIGINDIGGFGAVVAPTHTDLIAGYRQLIAQAHSRGVRILGATITPFEGALEDLVDGYYTPEKEAVRSRVNEWIRSGGEFDGVVDFDLAVRDPSHPTRIRADYDSGDRLHPNDAGYRVMGEAVELGSVLRRY